MKSIVIIGRRWNDPNGNTYFSSVGLIDGKVWAKIDFQYGYGNHYEHQTWKELVKNRQLDTLFGAREDEAPWSWCEKSDVRYYSHVSDVKGRRDL